MRPLLIPAFFATATGAAAAVWSATDNTVSAIPDGSSSGLARSLTINAGSESIVGVAVDLNLAAFAGDLYIYLTNGTDLAVLANRPGRRTGVPAGYSDDQPMTITFSTAGVSDFHNYRLTATGSHNTPLSAPLAGLWAADGRPADPAIVLDTDPRTAGLDVFTGDNGTGTWSLFAADLSSGATHQINSWTLTLTTVPEPSGAILAALALTGMARRRRSVR
jgi:subtilisin-like proprotein convertase family protein